MKVLLLTPAQRSALECADLSESPRVRVAWSRLARLYLPNGKEAREELASEINGLSNSEDALAAELSRKYGNGRHAGVRAAAGAALALANLYGKVLQAGTV